MYGSRYKQCVTSVLREFIQGHKGTHWVGKQDNSFRGGKRPWRNTAGDFLRKSFSDFTHSIPTLSLRHTAHLSSHSPETTVVLKRKHFWRRSMSWFTLRPLESEQRVLSTHWVSALCTHWVSARAHTSLPPQCIDVICYCKFLPIE